MLARSKARLGLPIRPHYSNDNESNLGPILPRFRDIRAFARKKITFFPHPTPIRAKISRSWSSYRHVVLGSAEIEHPRLTDFEIIFEESNMSSQSISVTDRRTDGRTDDMR